MTPAWEIWERDVQDLLGLNATPASGARWQALGDAVDTAHPSETFFPMIADCKYTTGKSYSITEKMWRQWQATAAEAGKRFILPIRINPSDKVFPADIVAISLEDFVELLELARGQ